MRNVNRCISTKPTVQQFFLVDTNFLVFRFLEAGRITDSAEQKRAQTAQIYWAEIDKLKKANLAKIFVLDVCIAEAFKTMAKMYYKKNGAFPQSSYLKSARDHLRKEISLSATMASKSKRDIRFHDIQTTRDIVIGVDRYFEKALKKNKNVSIIDLLILSTAQYLIDFLGFDRDRLHIITMDGALYDLARTYNELPAVYNPDRLSDAPSKVFT